MRLDFELVLSLFIGKLLIVSFLGIVYHHFMFNKEIVKKWGFAYTLLVQNDVRTKAIGIINSPFASAAALQA